ncbi:hypothetical protein Q7P37_011023 [Cladosporium fusiforme]
MVKRSRDTSTSSLDRETSTTEPSTPGELDTLSHAQKYAQLDHADPHTASMRCLLPPHKPLTFSSFLDYDTHYAQAHSNRCSECKVNLPSSHFLELHIAENHDPLALAQRERGEKTFGCFVEGCEKVCGDWKKRRNHLVDKHGFPRNYDFFVINSGVDGKRSMLRAGVDDQGHRASSRERRHSNETHSTVSTEATSVSTSAPATAAKTPLATKTEPLMKDTSSPRWKGKKRSGSTLSTPNGAPIAPVRSDMDSIISSMSALNMVPRSVANKKH